jgi:NTP pyrophosphatase (non-canonical NTP hydrolase)
MTNQLNITELSREIHATAKRSGFYDDDSLESRGITPGHCMMVVTELAEVVEADRIGNIFRRIHPENSISELAIRLNGVDNKLFMSEFENLVKDKMEDELADAVIRLLDLSAYFDIDLHTHIMLKMKYNSLRPYKHGKDY